MTIGLALAAAAIFGTGDFLGGLATRQTSGLLVLVISQLIGLVSILCLALAFGGTPAGSDLALGAAAGLAGAMGVAMLYRGLAIGVMAVVAPITGVVAAAVPLAAGLAAFGERPHSAQLIGAAGAIVAVAMLSGASRRAVSRARGMALLLALGSGVGFGCFYIAAARTHSTAGLWPLVAARGMSVTLFSTLVLLRRTPPRMARQPLLLTVGTGLLDGGANAMFLLAVRHGLLSIVAVLVSLYPAATMVCAVAILGERLRRLQGIGALLALGAVVLITTG